MDPQLTLWYFPIAVLLGALHALEPGHAKSLTAAYLIGIKGTFADAITLGLAVAITHSMLVVGLVALAVYVGANYENQSAFAEQVTHQFEIIFAGIIIVIALFMLLRRWRQYRASALAAEAHAHEHAHGIEHAHDHGHCHHGHNHQLPESVVAGERPSFLQIIAFGATGGMIPCPASIVVMLLAVSAHQASIGMIIVLGFSIGLAVALVGVGMLVVSGLRHLTQHRHFEKWSARAPLVSAAVLLASGVFALGRSLL
jgi:nickel/cobalt transporter (NicO) family protein